MKDIGIVTWHYYPNFGSALQAYAMQEVLQQLGIHVSLLIIEKDNSETAMLKRL